MHLMEMIDLYFRLGLSVLALSMASAIVAHPAINLVGVLVASMLYGASFGAWTHALGLTRSR